MNDRVTLSSSDDTEGLADDLRDELRSRGLPAAVRHVRAPRPGTLGAVEYVELALSALSAAPGVQALATALITRLNRADHVDIRCGDLKLRLTGEAAADRERLLNTLTEFLAPPKGRP